jgi:hypothetical protein
MDMGTNVYDFQASRDPFWFVFKFLMQQFLIKEDQTKIEILVINKLLLVERMVVVNNILLLTFWYFINIWAKTNENTLWVFYGKARRMD